MQRFYPRYGTARPAADDGNYEGGDDHLSGVELVETEQVVGKHQGDQTAPGIDRDDGLSLKFAEGLFHHFTQLFRYGLERRALGLDRRDREIDCAAEQRGEEQYEGRMGRQAQLFEGDAQDSDLHKGQQQTQNQDETDQLKRIEGHSRLFAYCVSQDAGEFDDIGRMYYAVGAPNLMDPCPAQKFFGVSKE